MLYRSTILVLVASVLQLVSSGQDSGSSARVRRHLNEENGILSSIESLVTFPGATLQFAHDSAEFQRTETPDMTPRRNEEYDFIVVGAGSAGATVAGRLAETPNVTVLLLEGGPPEKLIMDVPLLVQYLQFSKDINWKYRTEASNDYCRGMTDQRCNWPRGKVMGGSSVLNYMIATRGNPRDYDLWAEMGNEGWSYKDLLPYFKKLESMQIPDLASDLTQHNIDGPVQISFPPYHTPLATAFLEAGREMGFDIVDYNGGQMTGFSYVQTTMFNGTRVSSNKAYLHPARNRSNLFVSKNSFVSKVLLDTSGERAVGVEFLKHGREIVARARKEVILCAGAIGSPQLLMLSGIGPKDHLAEMGIPLVKDAAVGENLMDHIAYGGFVFLVDESVSIVTRELLGNATSTLGDYFADREGPLSVPGGCEALAFLDVDNPSDNDAWPNVELLFQGASMVSDPFVHHVFGITSEVWEKSYSSIENRHSWSTLPMLLRPKSRGRILLQNKDVKTDPRLIPNYLSDPDDLRIIIASIRATLAISKTEAMQRYGTRLHDTPLAGCEDHTFDSDDYWECAARTLTFTIYHHAGTCKMGPASDPTAVVNPRLQVHGIEGLRVADASIMPVIPAAHTNIPTIMIGEKLADMVKEDWGYPTEPLEEQDEWNAHVVATEYFDSPFGRTRGNIFGQNRRFDREFWYGG